MSVDIKSMSHDEAARTLRILERAGSREQEKMLALAERAAATAPPEWRHVYDTRVEIYRAGRTVRWKKTTDEDFDPQLVRDVEAVFSITNEGE
jgi:hypothetical protein